VVVIGLVTVFLLVRMDKIAPARVIQAVPADALILIENVDYEYIAETFVKENRIWIDFVNTTGKLKLDSTVNAAIEKIGSNAELYEILLKEGLAVSLHLLGKDQVVPLVYIPYADRVSDNDFEQLILAILDREDMINERRYETEVLYDVSGKPGSMASRFSFACVNGICLISPSSILVEEAVRTMHGDPVLENDPGLSMIRSTAGRYVHANIYVDYRNFSKLFRPVLKENSWGILEGISRLADWGEIDLDIKGDAIIMNGMTGTGGDVPGFLSVFKDQAPVKMEIHERLPSGTSYFLHFGISDPAQFRGQMGAYLESSGMGTNLAAKGSELKDMYGIDPIEDLFQVLDDEMTWFAIEGVTAARGEGVLMLETRSRSETTEMVRNWISSYLQVHSFDMESYRSVYQLDDQTTFNIYKMPDFYPEGMVGSWLFDDFVAVYENCLIFAPSVDVISRIIYQNILHKTLVSDAVYKEMSDYFSNRSNLTLFIRPFTWLNLLSSDLNDQAREKLKSMELFLRRIPGLVVQYSSEESLLYQGISLQYTSQIREKAMTVWESLLDTVAVIKPALVTNHNTSEKEIFVQDAANKTYLINGTGRILWEQKIGGAILGEVYQVDFYKNGKLQYLFNTRDNLYLIDRNGNFVERYPIPLRSPATSPMGLFDYDNSRDYRIFVAGEDRKIYVYTIEGDIVTGWRFGKTESEVTTPPQHFRIGDNDYILLSDRNRAYFLNRRGRDRIRPDQRVVFSHSNSFYLDMNIREDRPRFVSTDTSGNVVGVYLDGEVSTLSDLEAEPGHFFLMQDMDLDGVPDYVLAEQDELKVIGQDGTRLFTYRVRGRISQLPDIYKFSASDIKVGITDGERNRIYLVNSDGSLYEGFPLEGSTRFSIGYFAGSDSRFNLIVGSSNNFLYNYSIE